MPAIRSIRPVLLSAPYAEPDDLEVRIHLSNGRRVCGLVELVLDDGTSGLGEGYIAVFAPRVFVELVDLISPHLLGRDAFDIPARYMDSCAMTDYFSLQGAARHAIAAIEMALHDALGKASGLPVWKLLGGQAPAPLALYGSGGDSAEPAAMAREIEVLAGLGMDCFKIRARAAEPRKAVWTMLAARRAGIGLAVDMTQNLARRSHSVAEVAAFVERLRADAGEAPVFLEEALGPRSLPMLPALRAATGCRLAGGEIVTTAEELCERVERGWYDIAQPDASVIGGCRETLAVCAHAARHGAEAAVHSWGGGVALQANYHVAFAAGAGLAEWPMKRFPLRDELLVEPLAIRGGRLAAPEAPGLGVRLTPEIERRYPFRPDSVYRCDGDRSVIPLDVTWPISRA